MMRVGRWRAASVLACAMAVALALAGCVRLPDSGAPQRIGEVATHGNGGYVFNASGPQQDASPTDIITGFILASADTRGSHSVARQFLTEEFASAWVPEAQVDVVAQMPQPTQSDEDTYTTQSQRVATLAGDGVYRPDASQVDQTYRLTQVNGQWRIAQAPQGITVTESSFTLAFRAARLAFVAPDGRTLVPDVRWIQAGDQSATRVVKALLAGPTPLLSGAIASAQAEGPTLAVDSVAVNDSVATVSLTADFLLLNEQAQRRLKTQLLRTLADVSSVTAVNIMVNNVRVDIQPYTTDELDFPRMASGTLVTVTGSGVAAVDDSSWEPRQDLSDATRRAVQAVQSRQPHSIAVANGRVAAVVSDGLIWVGSDGTVHELAGIVPDQVSLDVSGYAWWAADGEARWLNTETGETGSVRPPQGNAVQRVQVAPDGARIGIVGDGALRAQGIVRGADGRPTGLTAGVDVGSTTETVTALGWYGDDTLVYAATTADGSTTTLAPISGAVESVYGSQRIDALVGGANQSVLRALSAGSLLARQGSGWVDARQTFVALTVVWL